MHVILAVFQLWETLVELFAAGSTIDLYVAEFIQRKSLCWAPTLAWSSDHCCNKVDMHHRDVWAHDTIEFYYFEGKLIGSASFLAAEAPVELG